MLIFTILIMFSWKPKEVVEYNGVWENVIDVTKCNETNLPRGGKE